MKLKYYMRGLGIGILVTALIMGIALQSKRELSDAEIKERASKLGMVEESAVLLPEPKAQVTPTEASESTKAAEAEAENTETPEPEATKTETMTAEPDQKEEAKVADEAVLEKEDAAGVAGGSTDTKTKDQTIDDTRTSSLEKTGTNKTNQSAVITVESGNGSDTVSRKLFEAGMIDNAQTFDKYLCSHDYDYKITIGKHTIPAGATYDEIAAILISAAE